MQPYYYIIILVMNFMEIKEKYYLRESIRFLVRNLGILEKDESTCCGITISQCHAIVEIGRSIKISSTKLAKLLSLNKSTMSRNLDNLIKDGLVTKETHPSDRRSIIIRLTDKGINIFNKIESDMDEYYKNIFISIPENDRPQVLNSLQILIDSINEHK